MFDIGHLKVRFICFCNRLIDSWYLFYSQKSNQVSNICALSVLLQLLAKRWLKMKHNLNCR